jgi:hypothetical protein
METYAQAVTDNIKGQGKPISDWLAREAKKLRSDGK